MFRLTARKLMALALATGVFLVGGVPAYAVTIAGRDDNLPSMTMVMFEGAPCDCADMMSMNMASKDMPAKGMPTKKTPCKNCNLCYAVCAAYAANSSVFHVTPFAISLRVGLYRLAATDTSLDGIGHPPALPPPILHA